MPYFGDPLAGGMPSAGSQSSSTGSLSSYSNQLGVPLGATPAAPGGSQFSISYGPGQRPIADIYGTPYIYMGQTKAYSAPQAHISSVHDDASLPDSSPYSVKLRSADDLIHKFEKMAVEDQRKLALQLAIGGYAGSMDLTDVSEWVKTAPLPEVEAAYSNLLSDAANRWSVGHKLTPDDLLSQSVAYRLHGEGIKWDGDLGSLDLNTFTDIASQAGAIVDLSGTHTRTSTSKSVDIMDPMDAQAMTRGMLQAELGRDPTKAEYEDFTSALIAAQRHDPTITRTTQTYSTDADGSLSADGNQTSSSVTHQGIGAAGLTQLAYQKAQSQPGWAEWQAMGTYAPALFAALGSTVPGV